MKNRIRYGMVCAAFLFYLTGCARDRSVEGFSSGVETPGQEIQTTAENIILEVTEEAESILDTTEVTLQKGEADMPPPVLVPETEEEEKEITLLFAGDFLLSEYVMNAYNQAGSITGVLDEPILNAAHEADIFMVNEEFPFSNRGTAADKQYTFRSDPKYASILTEAGIDLVTLANNHALDYGRDALSDTFAALKTEKIDYVGAGENLEEAGQLKILERSGVRIGFLGASRVIPEFSWNAGENTSGLMTTYDPANLLERIRQSTTQCDYLIVYVHWGIERNNMPEEYERTLARQYIDAGADAVIGSHPHVLQGMEFYQGKPVFYSLGNFVFGSSIPKTMLVKLTLQGNKLDNVQIIPATSQGGYTHQIEETELPEFYSWIQSLSRNIAIDQEGKLTVLP